MAWPGRCPNRFVNDDPGRALLRTRRPKTSDYDSAMMVWGVGRVGQRRRRRNLAIDTQKRHSGLTPRARNIDHYLSSAKCERMRGVVEITEFIWLEEIVEKLARKHHIEVHEAEEVFAGLPKFRFVEKGHRADEHVYSASGRTEAGRCLIVFFVHKTDGSALPLSARNMTKAERRIYERK